MWIELVTKCGVVINLENIIKHVTHYHTTYREAAYFYCTCKLEITHSVNPRIISIPVITTVYLGKIAQCIVRNIYLDERLEKTTNWLIWLRMSPHFAANSSCIKHKIYKWIDRDLRVDATNYKLQRRNCVYQRYISSQRGYNYNVLQRKCYYTVDDNCMVVACHESCSTLVEYLY